MRQLMFCLILPACNFTSHQPEEITLGSSVQVARNVVLKREGIEALTSKTHVHWRWSQIQRCWGAAGPRRVHRGYELSWCLPPHTLFLGGRGISQCEFSRWYPIQWGFFEEQVHHSPLLMPSQGSYWQQTCQGIAWPQRDTVPVPFLL